MNSPNSMETQIFDGFIPTLLGREISQLCDFTRVSQTIAFLHGPNQSGKTTNLVEYQRRNEAKGTCFVRVPMGGSCGGTIEALAVAAGITQHDSTSGLLKRMQRAFKREMLLIVDEAHQLFQCGVKRRTLEAFRELHDLTGMGILFCGTDVMVEMLEDKKFAGFLGQLANRGTIRRRIKAEPYAEDVYRFCEAFGFGVPEKGSEEAREVFAIANGRGLGKLSKVFQMAQRWAENRREAYSWRAFLVTVATLRNWERGEVRKQEAERGVFSCPNVELAA